MAEKLLIGSGVRVKQRSPWAVFFLSLLTMWIYLGVWYYKVNRELRDYGKAFKAPPLNDNPLEVKPLVAALAISPLSLFLLFIPALVSTSRTGRRVRRAEELSGSRELVDLSTGATMYWLGGVLLPFWAVYLQSHLNGLWETCARAETSREPGAAAEWLADPTGRHQHRYWDGTAWSEHVADDGRQGVDLIAPVTVQAAAGETKTCPDCAEEIKAAAAVCRFCGHRFAPAGEAVREPEGAVPGR